MQCFACGGSSPLKNAEMVGMSASKVGNAICESGSRRSRIHVCRIFGGQALTTPRRGTSPGTNSTPGMGLIFLRLTFGDPLGFWREAAGSSDKVDGGGGLDDSSFDRDQKKESIVVDSWGVVQVSGEQTARPQDGEDDGIEVGEYKGLPSSGEARFRRVDVGRRIRFVRTTCYTLHTDTWITHETDPSLFPGNNSTCTTHEARTKS